MARVSRFRKTMGWVALALALGSIAIVTFRPIRTQVIDLKVGQGAEARAGDEVAVHYVGKLDDGTNFDSSKSRGRPFLVEVGRGQVIRGWDLGLEGMKIGGVRRLVIPPEEGYGTRGLPPSIPPDSRLHFEIELVEVRRSGRIAGDE